MEFADKLLVYKNKRKELITKIQNIFNNLDMDLPTLERDNKGSTIVPFDIDPFTIFALFNKHITFENRIGILTQIKKEFSLNCEIPYAFQGIAVVNNLKATFYFFSSQRGENDINNLWKLYETALNYSDDKYDEFVKLYNTVLTQQGVRWNITIGLYWIRPYLFINLDKTNRDLLSLDDTFSRDFKNQIKSLKNPPKGDVYLKICGEAKNSIDKSDKFTSFPHFSLCAYLFKNNDLEDEKGDSDVQTVKYWLISPGENARWIDEFYKNDEIGIGFHKTGDLAQFGDKKELTEKFQEIYNDTSSHRNDVHACWQFVHDMQIGDIVFVKKGMNNILARGIIRSDYEYNTDKPYHKIRKVKWTHKGNWESEDKLPVKTLTDITDYPDFVKSIKNLFITDENSDDEVSEINYPQYGEDDFLDEVYIDKNDYRTLKSLLKIKKNLIVEGAPGVGKTFLAKRLAYSIIGEENPQQVHMVQFHQSYSYEDFVMGYKPSKEGFELKKGSFYEFCKNAEVDGEKDYFFIIDEINRGNLSKIFGELFMLIENDKRGDKNKITLVYSNELFYIPRNVYIIGLMNTADRSLAMIDYALRRRFAFFNLKPGFDSDAFRQYQKELENSCFDSLINVIRELNMEIKDDENLGEGFRIGHSYLCNLKPEDGDEKLKYIVEYEIIPLLKEYWFDETVKIREWSDKLRSVFDDSD